MGPPFKSSDLNVRLHLDFWQKNKNNNNNNDDGPFRPDCDATTDTLQRLG